MTTRKRQITAVDSSIVDVWKRELGQLPTRRFTNRLAASEDLVLRFDILHKLDEHRGCVNTVSFNDSGEILASGSDDMRVVLWNWEAGRVQLSFHSGHHNNVFQAKFMPYTDDRSIVTCAADGQVRLAQILESGKVETKLLAKHHERAHKLTIEPGSSHVFYTCGEDGLVQHIDLRSGAATSLFTCKPVQKHGYLSNVGLNAITMARNPNLLAVGGSDQFARLYDIRKTRWDASSDIDRPVDLFCPPHLVGDEHVGITGLAFSDQNELLVSYNNEFIYLFTMDIGLGPDPDFTSQLSSTEDAANKSAKYNQGSSSDSADDNVKVGPQAYKGHRNCETVKGVNFFGPKSEYVVSGSDCGRIFIWKKKGGELIRVMEADKHIVNCIESHPHDTVLASSGIEHYVKVWIPKSIDRASLPTNIQKRRPRPRGFTHRMISPEELMFELFSVQRQITDSESSEDHLRRDLIQLLVSFDTNNDGSSDDVEDTD